MFDVLHLKLKEFLQRMFDIRVGEFRRLWLMLLNIYLLILCLWIIKPIVNAQFLSRVGVENLPLVFFMVAMTALAFSTGYSRLLNRKALGPIIRRTYLISILCLLIFAVLFNLGMFQDWMSYPFYIGGALFGLITTSQFWLLGNLVFNSLEAKRLFGFIGAGAIAGGISGGYLTSLLAPGMTSTNLLYLAAGLLVISMVINHRIWVTYALDSHNPVENKLTKEIYEYPLRLIRNSKHLTYLALIIGIGVVVAKLVEYQYSAIASASIKDPDSLAAFFGFWFSTSNAVSLGIQLLATQRIIGYLGVGRSLFVLPGALFAGAAMVLYTPVLWAGTTLKLLDISLKQSINKAATELLILPIPMAIKNQTKTFIDVFVDTTATGLGGIILIFLINGLNLSVRAVCFMILVLICIWIYLVIRVKKEYFLTFKDKLNLSSQTHTKNKKEGQQSDTSVVKGIRQTLQSGSTQQILYFLDRIEETKDHRLMQDLIPLLKHESPAVRQGSLRCLYYHTDHTIIQQIEPLLKDPDEEVRSRAFSCILAHTRHDRIDFIEDSLNDKDPAISGAALVGLATEARDNEEMQQLFKLNQRIRDKINQIKRIEDPKEKEAIKILVVRAIGYGKLEAFYPLLIAYMQDKNPAVSKQAILSAGNSQDTSFVKLLLTFLLKASKRSSAKKALSKYEPAEILPVLADLSRERDLAHEIMLQLPSLAETMDTQKAIDYLYELVQHHDHEVKLKALEALHKVKATFPHLTVGDKRVMPILMEEAGLYSDTLALNYVAQDHRRSQQEDPKIGAARKELIQLLERRLDSTLERIFWILGLNYPPGIILPLYKNLHHDDPEIRMNTVEILDNILEPALKQVVLPIVETAIRDTLSVEALKSLNVEAPTAISCFESLLQGHEVQLKLAVLKLIDALDDPDFTHLVRMAVEDENVRVREVAGGMLE